MVDLFVGETDLVSLRSTLLFGMKGMAAYAHHADRLGQRDEEINQWFYKGLCEITGKIPSMSGWSCSGIWPGQSEVYGITG